MTFNNPKCTVFGKDRFYFNKNESYTKITRATHSNQPTTLANKIELIAKCRSSIILRQINVINNFNYTFIFRSR